MGVVVVAYGAEPQLGECVSAIIASSGVTAQVIVVDNGADGAALAQVRQQPGVTIAGDGTNLGFAGGCNYGAALCQAPYLAFVNSDAIVAPDCLAQLARALDDPGVGLVSGSVRLAERPDQMNSAGNPVHFLYFSWAGGLGDQASEHEARVPIASVSGATFALRSQLWHQLGGFDPNYFLYCEDVDLSMRTWQAGYRVEFVPQAVSWHSWQFSRNQDKLYFLERNRLINLLTLPETATLARLSPVILGVELALLAISMRAGWLSQKWRGYRWLLDNRSYLRQRRRRTQAARRVPDVALNRLMSPRMAIPEGFGLNAPELADSALAAYWRAIS